MKNPKLFRITTIPLSLEVLLTGQLDFMKANGFEVHAVSSSGIESTHFTKERGIPFHTVEMTRTISPIKDLIALYRLYILLKKERPEIVHTHTPKAGLLGMIAAYLAGIKHRVHTVAGLPLMTTTGTRKKLLTLTEKITYKLSTNTLANSFSIAEYLLKNNFLEIDKLRVIGNGSSNGYDDVRYNPANLKADYLNVVKEEINYSEDNFYCLYVGRLVNDKGIGELFEAFCNAYKQRSNLKLIILGKFEKERDSLIEQKVLEIINHPGVIFLGWRTDVEYFLELANVLIHPSHREGFPNILLQAGAMGTPIICSKIIGNIDIVSNDTAQLFKVKSSEEILKSLFTVIDNYNAAKNKAQILKTKIISNYSRKVIHEQILSYYLHTISIHNEEVISNQIAKKKQFFLDKEDLLEGILNIH